MPYVMTYLCASWIAYTLQTQFGAEIFDLFGTPYAPIVQSIAVLSILRLICFWLYRQRIFIRI